MRRGRLGARVCYKAAQTAPFINQQPRRPFRTSRDSSGSSPATACYAEAASVSCGPGLMPTCECVPDPAKQRGGGRHSWRQELGGGAKEEHLTQHLPRLPPAPPRRPSCAATVPLLPACRSARTWPLAVAALTASGASRWVARGVVLEVRLMCLHTCLLPASTHSSALSRSPMFRCVAPPPWQTARGWQQLLRSRRSRWCSWWGRAWQIRL